MKIGLDSWSVTHSSAFGLAGIFFLLVSWPRNQKSHLVEFDTIWLSSPNKPLWLALTMICGTKCDCFLHHPKSQINIYSAWLFKLPTTCITSVCTCNCWVWCHPMKNKFCIFIHDHSHQKKKNCSGEYGHDMASWLYACRNLRPKNIICRDSHTSFVWNRMHNSFLKYHSALSLLFNLEMRIWTRHGWQASLRVLTTQIWSTLMYPCYAMKYWIHSLRLMIQDSNTSHISQIAAKESSH